MYLSTRCTHWHTSLLSNLWCARRVVLYRFTQYSLLSNLWCASSIPALLFRHKNPAQYLLPIEQWSRDYRVPSYLADPLQKPEAVDGDAHCKLCPMQKGPK